MDKQQYAEYIKQLRAHEEEYIANCGCGKRLMRKDVSFSQQMFGRVSCRLCSHFGTPPLSERYNLADPVERKIAEEVGMAEGREVYNQLRARKA